MGYYEDIYIKRVNRFGTDFKSRIEGEREKGFADYLDRSIYTMNFTYNQTQYKGTFEPYKQNETETLHYLLTARTLHIPNGTIISFNNIPWMVYWKEDKISSGYNRYTMLKMTHQIQLNDNVTLNAYMYGPGDSNIQDTLKSTKTQVVYNEAGNLNFLIMPATEHIHKDDYFSITTVNNSFTYTQGFRVTGFDIISTPGIEYVSVDPMYIKDITPAPTQQPTDNPNDFYWINMEK